MVVVVRSARTLRSMAALVSVVVERRARVHASGWAARRPALVGARPRAICICIPRVSLPGPGGWGPPDRTFFKFINDNLLKKVT